MCADESVGKSADFCIKNEVKSILRSAVAGDHYILPYCVTAEEGGDGGTLLRKIPAFTAIGKDGAADTKILFCRVACANTFKQIVSQFCTPGAQFIQPRCLAACDGVDQHFTFREHDLTAFARGADKIEPCIAALHC